MKTLEEIKDLMVGKSVITNLADLLRANDEEFAESEKNISLRLKPSAPSCQLSLHLFWMSIWPPANPM